MTHASFKRQFPDLDPQPLDAVRSRIPAQWEAALRDGTATAWDDDCIPSDLLADVDDDTSSHRQRLAVTAPPTMIQRVDTPLHIKLRVTHIYRAIKARCFTIPRVFVRPRHDRQGREGSPYLLTCIGRRSL